MKTAAKYRILTADRRLKYAGTDTGSWFTLEKARQLVNYSAGEMIYEYWHHPQHGPEPMHEVF
jgi:hypothetical protein